MVVDFAQAYFIGAFLLVIELSSLRLRFLEVIDLDIDSLVLNFSSGSTKQGETVTHRHPKRSVKGVSVLGRGSARLTMSARDWHRLLKF